MIFDDINYARRERLSYLDQCFAWRGMANRRDLIDRFGVSTAQAALDFKVYLERAVGTPPIYDSRLKTYLADPDHQSLFPDSLHDNWTRIISDSGSERFDELPRLNRLSNPSIMSKLYRAMEERLAIQIQYTSMTTGKDDGQWIVPTRFASDGDRIHLRAFSFKHNEYRDYVPVRIGAGSSFKTRPLDSDLPSDEDWETIARIHLVPKAGLSEEQVKAVRREYGFKGKSLCIETRKALEFYAVRRWGLDQRNARLERHSTEYAPLP
jgi:hypothetical protein